MIWYNIGRKAGGMDKVGKAGMKVARSRGEIVPRDFAAAVKDIKLAILQSRARAAHASNVEALKLYFYVGGYVSKKSRTAKWGSGAIDALSNRLQVELPGLRGFSASNIKSMRIFYEAWKEECQIRQTASAESVSQDNRPTSLGESVIRQSSTDELATYKWRNAFSFNSTIANGREPHDSSPRSSKVSAANSPTGSRNAPRRKAAYEENREYTIRYAAG